MLDECSPRVANLGSNEGEQLELDDAYSPALHRINEAIRRRAVYDREEIGPPAEILTRYSHPSDEVVQRAEDSLAELIKTASVKKGEWCRVCCVCSVFFAGLVRRSSRWLYGVDECKTASNQIFQERCIYIIFRSFTLRLLVLPYDSVYSLIFLGAVRSFLYLPFID